MLLNKIFSTKRLAALALVLLLMAFMTTGCQPAAATEITEGEHEEEQETDHEHETEEEHDHEDGEHGDEHSGRVPNEGAVVHFVSPTDEANFQHGEDIVVEIETENFDLTAEGNHWHLYVDGSILTMVADGATKTVIHALEPGEHEIEAYLGLPTHEELEEGASITITVTE